MIGFRLSFCFALAGFIVNPSFSNSDSTNTSNSPLFQKANELLTKGKFGSALPLWYQIQQEDQANANKNFKLGLCYLNSLDQQKKSLPYFKKAVGSISEKYSFKEETEAGAPPEAYYFLAEAYMAINEPDSAYEKYRVYQDLMKGVPAVDVDRQMLMSVNAKQAKKKPRDITLKNFEGPVNSTYPETNPVLTIDNSIVFFSSRKPGEEGNNAMQDEVAGQLTQDIYYAQKNQSGKWSTPVAFNGNSIANDVPLALSADGLTFYFANDKAGVWNIYQSAFVDGVWAKPEPLSVVNSPYNEVGLSISGDGNYLYFSSDRDGGLGKMDIYVCEKKGNKWGKPKNAGKDINTKYDERSPFIHPNGRTLFFSTNGNQNKGVGGFDVFYAELTDKDKWGEPQNLGYPINTTLDDLGYYITAGGSRYYSRLNEDQSFDLYEIEGGGFEVENLEVGTEVVTLTQEMDVTEVLEVEEVVEKEVEVVEMVETEVVVEKEVEVLDLSNLEEIPEDPVEEEPEETLSLVEQIDLDSLSEKDREELVSKVKSYLDKEIEENESVIFKTIYFDFNSSNLSLLSKNELQVFAEYVEENPEKKIEIIGHTDNVGTWEANIKVSGSRARQVFQFLQQKGIKQSRMIYYGKGPAAPIASNDTEAGQSKNRRVEVVLSK